MGRDGWMGEGQGFEKMGEKQVMVFGHKERKRRNIL